jgi:hypothetical protein
MELIFLLSVKSSKSAGLLKYLTAKKIELSELAFPPLLLINSTDGLFSRIATSKTVDPSSCSEFISAPWLKRNSSTSFLL